VTDANAPDPGYALAADGSFTAPLTLAYPYARTAGPTYGRFLTGLASRQLSGTRGDDGRVFVPPAEFDPTTGNALSDVVDVADHGTVVSWSWQAEPVDGQPLDRPFAWVLVRLDGADTAMVHACAAADASVMHTGMQVQAVWADDAEPGIGALAWFEPIDNTGGNDE
jgi:uncharacterized OB-fold protein